MKKKPNVVFVLTDDQGYGDLGCTGNPVIKTPFIDEFYNESNRFTNYHVGPTCAPTRSGIMTGHYANSTGVWHTIGGRSLLRKNEWTLASAFKENGYKTAMFGKWHLGDEYPYRPHDRGFEKAIVHGGGGISQTPDYWGNDYFDDTYFVNGKEQKFEGYCTDVFFREALKFIKENKDDQFFCYIALNAPHQPCNVDNRYSNLYKDQISTLYKDLDSETIEKIEYYTSKDIMCNFYGMITNIDENFGVLRDKLNKWGIEDNTILIFMTDNGTANGINRDCREFMIEGYNAGLRGQKGSAYDGGHRVPFFIRWPDGNINTSKDINTLTANIDLMPTLLDLADIPYKENVNFHGKSLKPLLHENEGKWEERTIVTDSQRNTYPQKWRKSSVMTDRWRLINGRELYDVSKDREQLDDVAFKYPKVVEKLRLDYEKWWDIVSLQYDTLIPISIGKRPTSFTNHDMRNDESFNAFSQRLIRIGMSVFGYYEIEIEEDGVYEFELRRWPASENRPIQSGIEGDDVEFRKEHIHKNDHACYTGGKALLLKEAFIRIQGINKKIKVNSGDTKATFIIKLKKGSTNLEAWFGNGDMAITSAYYISARKRGGIN